MFPAGVESIMTVDKKIVIAMGYESRIKKRGASYVKAFHSYSCLFDDGYKF